MADSQQNAYTLVLVGGSGQRFGVVAGWLGVLGLIDPPSRVVVVDAEGAPGQPPGSLGNVLEKLVSYANPACTVVRYAPYSAVASTATNSNQEPVDAGICAKRLIEHGTSPLWDLCLPADEQIHDVAEGFFAKPRLASTVFWNDLLQGRNGFLIHELRGGAPASKDHVVVVAGSVSGGTGAGLIPLVIQQYAQASQAKALFAICFTKHFTTAGVPGAPDDALLRDNAANGARFFIDQCLSDPNVSAGFLLGNPVGTPAVPAQNGVHLFPGYLLAAALLGRNCGELLSWWRAQKLAAGQDLPKLAMFGVRDGNVYFRGDDLAFRQRDENKVVGGDDIHPLITIAGAELQRLHDHPLSASLGFANLFPRNRMHPFIFDAVASQDPAGRGKARKAVAARFEKALREETGFAANVLEAFRGWLGSLNTQICPEGSHAFCSTRDPDSAQRVNRVPWRRCLARPSELGLRSDVAQFWAQGWSKDVVRSTVKAGLAEPAQDTSRRWAIEFATTMGPMGLGPSLHDSRIVNPLSPIPASSVDGRTYPSPLGEAHAFASRLMANDRGTIDLAQLLWRCLALGAVRLENFEVDNGPTEFEKVVHAAEPRCRLSGILVTTGRLQDPKREPVVPAGIRIGATHPRCGLWTPPIDHPGFPSGVVVQRLVQAFSQAWMGSLRREADLALTAFYESLKLEKPAISGPLRVILQPIAEACRSQTDCPSGPLSYDNLRTTLPIRVQLNCDEEATLLYPCQWDDGRAANLLLLRSALHQGTIQVQAQGHVAKVVHLTRTVAQLNVRIVMKDATQDKETSKFLGCGDLSIFGGIPAAVSSSGAASSNTTDASHLFETHEESVRRTFHDQTDTAIHRLPDLLWKR